LDGKFGPILPARTTSRPKLKKADEVSQKISLRSHPKPDKATFQAACWHFGFDDLKDSVV
jgi:hypothetical protein